MRALALLAALLFPATILADSNLSGPAMITDGDMLRFSDAQAFATFNRRLAGSDGCVGPAGV